MLRIWHTWLCVLSGESVSSEAAGAGEPRGAEIQTAVPEEGAGGRGLQTEAGGHHTAERQESCVKHTVSFWDWSLAFTSFSSPLWCSSGPHGFDSDPHPSALHQPLNKETKAPQNLSEDDQLCRNDRFIKNSKKSKVEKSSTFKTNRFRRVLCFFYREVRTQILGVWLICRPWVLHHQTLRPVFLTDNQHVFTVRDASSVMKTAVIWFLWGGSERLFSWFPSKAE